MRNLRVVLLSLVLVALLAWGIQQLATGQDGSAASILLFAALVSLPLAGSLAQALRGPSGRDLDPVDRVILLTLVLMAFGVGLFVALVEGAFGHVSGVHFREFLIVVGLVLCLFLLIKLIRTRSKRGSTSE
jgi:MFS family permease